MLTTTRNAITAICATDATIDQTRVKVALAVLDGASSGAREPTDRVLSAGEVADILHCCTRTVQTMAERGSIRRVYRTGRGVRAAGYSERSVRDFVAGIADGEKMI